jgi:hypothetical protein
MGFLDDSKVKISDGTSDSEVKRVRAEADPAAGLAGGASNDPGRDVQ